MHANPFTDDELAARLARVRAEMADRALDLLILFAPENVFYLTGLEHWGFFAPHLLAVPVEGDMVLITRAMERVAIANMVRNAAFEGHSDSETVVDKAAAVLSGPETRRIGLEMDTSGLSFSLGRALITAIPAIWSDATGLVDELRLVKSQAEQDLMRRAAKASDAGTQAAIAALHDGAQECDVAAECLAAMTRAGGTPPGFGPFIRPEARIAEEHTSWGDGIYRDGERVFLEIAGCVSRYNAPMGRLVHLGAIKDQDAEMADIAKNAFAALLAGLKPETRARDVYASWQGAVDAAGMHHYRRHHCGYLVGIGFPPSWTGGNRVTGLRHDSDLLIKEGMTFHAMSWFTETGRGDWFLSNTVLLGPDGAEVLTTTAAGPTVI